MKRKTPYIRKGKKYKIEEVLPFVEFKAQKINLGGDLIKVQSLRLRTFKEHGCKCVGCGLEASFFVKEKTENDGGFHVNLYGINEKGEEILFTHDHIQPKSKGGKNNLSNTQTMCTNCNRIKGDKWEG